MAEDQDDLEVSDTRSWGGYRAKKTEAMPKATLFGSSLEMKSEKQLENEKDVDGKSVSFKAKGGKRFFKRPQLSLPGN